MKERRKKALAMLLAMLLVIGLVPAPVSGALSGEGLVITGEDANPVTPLPASLTDGAVWTDKSVTSLGNGEFDITLTALGQDYKIEEPSDRENLDVVLVLDVSGSMGSNGRLANMKAAASSAAAILLGVEGNRVAVVKYSEYATEELNFTTSSSIVTNKINSFTANGGTNIQHAFYTAHRTIEKRTNSTNKPVIILMSDGEPTYYYNSVQTLTNQTTRQGNGSGSTGDHVWNTVKQAMYAKNSVNRLDIYTIGFGVNSLGNNARARATATLQPTLANTVNYRGNDAFNHKYWEDASTLSSDNAAGIFNAFVEIVNQLVNYKPMSYTLDPVTGNRNYTSIQIQDVLGSGFEVIGSLPGNVSQNGATITWELPAAEFMTIEPGSTSIPQDKVNQVSFRVKISDSATEGTYYTNASAEAVFTVADNNPAYAETSLAQNLTNKGWLTIWAPPVNVEVEINKTVTGPATGNRTFDFGIYYDQSGTNLAYSTPVSITVNGSGSSSDSVNLSLPASMFASGSAILYVKELSSTTDRFWTYDNQATKAVTITRSDKEGTVNFENVYAPKGTLTVKKEWSEGAPTTPVAFALQKAVGFNETNNPVEWATISSGHTLAGPEWEVEISNLNLGDYYRVVEGDMQDFEIYYDPSYIKFDASHLVKMITITNQYQTPKGKITLNKVWDDNNNGEGDRPSQLIFNYTGPTSGQAIMVPDGNGNWTTDQENLEFGTYTFTEVVPQDYKASEASLTATISQEPLEARNASLTFTNTYVEPRGTLTVSKEWKSDQGKEDYRPGFVTIQLFRNVTLTDDQGTSTDAAVQVGSDVELNEGNQWKYDFTDLMFGKYWVREITVPDYETAYSVPDLTLEKGTIADITKRTGGITITNTFANPKGEITVKKVWVESGVDKNQVRPDEITVTLMKGTESVATTTLSALNDWGTSFKNLELDGSIYTVTESAANPDDAAKLINYKQTIVYGGNGGGENSITISKDKRTSTATLTNTYAKGTIAVTKNWVDKENPVNERPDEATITLYKVVRTVLEENMTAIVVNEEDGTTSEAIVETTTREAIDKTVVETRTLDRSASQAGLTTIFYDLEMGENISYEVIEDGIPFYSTEYSAESLTLTKEAPNGILTVTNTYTDPKGTLTVYKAWNHGYNPNPENEFTIELYKNGEKILETTGTGSSIAFDDLDLKAAYTVKEKSIDNYQASDLSGFVYTPIKGDATVATGDVTVTNTYIPETGALQVNKKWAGTTGEAITVTLYRSSGETQDTQFSKTVTLDGNNNWQHTFTGLELYGPEGAYRYEARESGNLGLYDATNNQTPTLSISEIATITITNTYSPGAKGTLVIQKKWLGTDGNETDPPVESIQVFLKINGEEEESAMVLNQENNWTVTRSGLNADPSISYTVREAGSPEEFKATVVGEGSFTSQNLTKTITITNTMTEDAPKLEVTKKATKDTGFLEEGKTTFTYSVTLENTGNRTLGNLYILDDMVPTGAAIGGNLIYSPEPDGREDGKVRFDLPEDLTLAPSKSAVFTYTVTVDKAGTYDNTATGFGSYKNIEVSGEGSESVLVKAPGLSILKEVIGPTAITGTSGTFTYQITVKNDGEVDLANVKVKDVMTLVPNSAAVYSFGGTGNIIFDEGTKTFTIGALAAGSEENIIFTYTVNLNQPGTYNNTATVTGEYTDTVTGEEGPAEIQKLLTDSDSAQVRIIPPTRPNPPSGPSDPQPPVDIPDEDTPLTENPIDNPDIIIPEEDVPLGEMPQTGGVPAALFFGLGALATGSGLWLRRKEKGEKNLDQ